MSFKLILKKSYEVRSFQKERMEYCGGGQIGTFNSSAYAPFVNYRILSLFTISFNMVGKDWYSFHFKDALSKIPKQKVFRRK